VGVVEEGAGGRVFGKVGVRAPAEEDVAVGKRLERALAVGEEAVGHWVGVGEGGGHGVVVERD